MHRLIAILSFIALTAAAAAQSTDERALRDAVVGKTLYMRGFSAEPEVRWHWQAGKLVQDEPQLHAVTELQAKSLTIRGKRVEIDGERQTLLRSSDTEFILAPDKEKVRITVDLAGATPQAVLPSLAATLFYPGRDQALADIPAVFASELPGMVDINCCHTRSRDVAANCDCADTSPRCTRDGHPAGKRGLSRISVLSSADPEFSEAARKKKISGNVKVGMEVDEQGQPFDIWIVRPMGFGLNEKAGQAVSQYHFRPPTCRGTPARTSVFVDVNFQIF